MALRLKSLTLTIFSLASLAVAQQIGSVGDWPDWRGPDRDGISREKNLPDKWDPSQAPRLYYPGFDANGNRIAVDPVTGQTQPTAAGTIVPNSGNCARAGRGIVEIKRRSIFQGGYALAWATSADTEPMLASL